MNKTEFAKVLAPIVQTKTFSSNEQLMDAFKTLLKGTNDSTAFYSKLKDGANVQTFAKLMSQKQINLRSEEDYEPLKTSSYWDRPKADFVYTAKILPEIRNRYPETYKRVIKGQDVLPAGLGGKPEDGKTIWNAVNDAESEKGTSNKASSPTTNSNQSVDKDKIEKAVQSFAKDSVNKKWKLSAEQIPAITKFVSELVQKL